MNSKVWFIIGASRGFSRIWAEAALTRGDKVAVTARNVADKACPVLNMMRNTLPFLLQQLVAPVLQLRGDSLLARSLKPHLPKALPTT
jgi:NAD(P)-dependent dehydrogenase (short-subunit alcohol dehydrogenase family)